MRNSRNQRLFFLHVFASGNLPALSENAMQHKHIWAVWVVIRASSALATLLMFISGGANALDLNAQTSPLTLYGIDFEHPERLPACSEIDSNTDLNHYNGENALVLQPAPAACTTPLTACRVGEWTPMTFSPPSAARSTRIQGRMRTPGGIRAIYAMHIASADSGEAQRFEIGVKDIPDANVRAYLLAKYGEPDAAATSVEAASVVAELSQKLSPDTLLFWQF